MGGPEAAAALVEAWRRRRPQGTVMYFHKGPVMKHVVACALGVVLVSGVALVAQMRPGARVAKTYGLGLPRDVDKLAIDEDRKSTRLNSSH